MKNIKGNVSRYLVYFVSLVFSMVIYFTFVSLQYNQTVQDSIELSDTMSFMFLVSSFILLVFAAIFVFYSNLFFTRQRKREIGLYAMLGLRKKTIAKMMFYEICLMGLAALGMGCSVWRSSNQTVCHYLLNLMESQQRLILIFRFWLSSKPLECFSFLSL